MNSELKLAKRELIQRMKDDSDDKTPYKTTKADIDAWYDKINTTVFRGRLRGRFDHIEIRRKRGVWAHHKGELFNETQGLPPSINGNSVISHLSISSKFPNKRGFVNVLAHEMVHHYQLETDRVVTHGKSFWVWKSTFKKYGLTLQRIANI